MGRAPCCDKANVKKGPWSPEEDAQLKEYIEKNGTGANWIALPQKAGLRRCGKSCRLRWLNYLRPNLKHGEFSDQEDRVICSLFSSIGSRWSVIAAQLPGRTDNDIKNYWNTKLKKKLMAMAPSTEYRKRPHRANSLLLQTSSMASPSPYECGGNFTYITTPNIAFSRENITNPNFTTVISPNVSTQDGEFVGPPMNIEVKDGKNNSLIFGGDENLCSFQNYLMSNNGVGEDQEHEKLLISSTNDGCFSTENPLDYSIEEIKQLISSTNYNVCNNNLNFFVDDMMMIKAEEENVLNY